MKTLALIIASFLVLSAQANERSAFTNMKFGKVPGWGDYIRVENPDHLTEDKRYLLWEVEGMNYKDIIKETKKLHGKKFKCRLAEHFVATMGELGITIGDTTNMKIYIFDGSHTVLDLQDVAVTEENLEEIQFETNYCK